MTSQKYLLGRIAEINTYDLVVSLPNNRKGKVGIVNISDGYKKLLERLTEDDETEEDLAQLSELFTIGQMVRCALLPSSKPGRPLDLSLRPQDVNSGLTMTQLRQRHFVLQGAVLSVEDHGYTVELGLPGPPGFLPLDGAAAGLHVGQLLQLACKVRPDAFEAGGPLQLTAKASHTQHAVLPDTAALPLNALQPGQLLRARVRSQKGKEAKKSAQKGVLLLGFRDTPIVVVSEHCPKPVDEFDVKAEVIVRVLSVDLMSREVTGSLLPHLLPDAEGWDDFSRVEIGERVERALVERVQKRSALLRRLPEEGEEEEAHPLFLSIPAKHMSDSGKGSFPEVGSICSARLLDFDLIRNVAIATLKQSVLDAQYLRLEDISPGNLLRCAVKRIVKEGLVVRPSIKAGASNRLPVQGFVPFIHAADAPVSRPEEHFSAGQELRCRALVVEPGRRRLILTAKPSIVRSRLPRLCSLEQVRSGELASAVVHGVVVQVRPQGLLVAFFGDVRGFVRKAEAGLSEEDLLDKVFRPGQVLRCRIIGLSPKQDSLQLSLRLQHAKPIAQELRAQLACKPGLEVGAIFAAEVSSVQSTFFEVTLLDAASGVPVPDLPVARLPASHLADFPALSSALAASLKPSDRVPGSVALFVRGAASLQVTAKPALVRAAQAGRMQTSFKPEDVGGLFLGAIADQRQNYGLFVELPGRKRGLVPNKYILNGSSAVPPASFFAAGQTVEAKLVELHAEKDRYLLSLRPKDCYCRPEQVEDQEKALEDWLLAWEHVTFSAKSCLEGLLPGQIVRAKVTRLPEEGSEEPIECRLLLADGKKAKGVVQLANTAGVQPKAGIEVECILLHKDYTKGVAELCFSTEAVAAFKRRQENRFTAVKEGQQLKADVLIVQEEFVLLHLRGHATGKLAYMPAKRQWNDLVHKRQFHIGQSNAVIAKRVLPSGAVIVNLRSLQRLDRPPLVSEPQNGETSQLPTRLRAPQRSLDPGQVVGVRILKVLDRQLNVEIGVGGRRGRIFVTELRESMLQQVGRNPLHAFKEGQELQGAKIEGERQTKKKEGSRRPLLEITLRDGSDHDFSRGRRLPVFLKKNTARGLWFFAGRDHLAFCRCLNLAEDAEAVANLAVGVTAERPQGSLFWATVIVPPATVPEKQKRKRKSGERKTGHACPLPMLEVSLLRAPEQPVALGRTFCARVVRTHTLHARLLLPGEGRPLGQLHIFDLLPQGQALPPLSGEFLAERAPKGRLLTVQATARSSGPLPWRLRVPGAGVSWPEGAREVEGFVCGRLKQMSGRLVSLPPRAAGHKPQLSHLVASTAAEGRQVKALRIGERVRVRVVADGKKKEMRVRLAAWAENEQSADSSMEAVGTPESPNADRVAKINFVTRRQRLVSKGEVEEEDAGSWSDEEDENQRPMKRKRAGDDEKCDTKRARKDESEQRLPAVLELAVKNRPDSGRAWCEYIASFSCLGQLDRAREIAERALITISPTKLKALTEVFGALFRLEISANDDDAFRQLLTRAWRLGNDAAIGKMAVDTLLEAGRFEMAEGIAREVHRRCPTTQALPWRLLFRARFSAGKKREARDTVRLGMKALKGSEKEAFCISASELELECGEADRAIQNLQQLPELKTVGAKVLLLRALRGSGKTEEAERLLMEFSGPAEEVKLLERLREEEEDWDLPKLSGRKTQKEEGNEDDDEGEESEDEEEEEDESEEEEEEDESENSDDDEGNMEVDD